MSRLKVIPTSSRPPLARLVDDHLSSCRARGLSPKTVKDSYGYPLQHVFLPFCDREGITNVDELSNRVMDRYSSELLERGGKRGPLSRHSVHAYVRNVNLFLGWAQRQGESVEAKGQLPKLARRDIDVLSREEIGAMEAAAPTERDKLIIRVLADTGMRVGEVVGLRPADRGAGQNPGVMTFDPGQLMRSRRPFPQWTILLCQHFRAGEPRWAISGKAGCKS